MSYLYGGNILLVDLSRGKISKEPTSSYSGDYLGGRGINIKLLYDGVPPGTDPLDPVSLIIFGVGPLSGTPVPASRVEITAKSPETGYLGSSNFGGYFGPELKFAGYDNIAVTGKADKPVYLWIHNEEVEIRDASHLWGKDTYQTQEIIRSEIDAEARVACIGPAGENLVRFATVQHELGHGAGRTGMGAVMGSKNLKAIVVRGTKGVAIADPQKYLTLAQAVQQEMRKHPIVQEKQKFGVSRVQNAHGAEWDPIDGRSYKISPDTGQKEAVLPDVNFLKYAPKRAGCHGCPTQCMDMYPVEAKGGGTISCVLYGGPKAVGAETNADLMLESSLLAQRAGMDIASSTAIISWLMELYNKGIITAKDTDGIPMEWGSREAIIGMMQKMVRREGFGDVIADGILPAAERIGRGAIDYAYHVKGLPQPSSHSSALPGSKGMALSIAVGRRADGMKGRAETGFTDTYNVLAFLQGPEMAGKLTEANRKRYREIADTDKGFDSGEYEGKPELLAYCEDIVIIDDLLSACKLCSSFLTYPFDEEYQAELFSAGSGIETSLEELFNIARRVRNLERAYNVREGMTREIDSLPKMFLDKPVEEGIYKGDVLESGKFEEMKSRYYTLRGWDVATGIPTRETLEQTGLGDVAKDLERRGKLPKKAAEGRSNREKR